MENEEKEEKKTKRKGQRQRISKPRQVHIREEMPTCGVLAAFAYMAAEVENEERRKCGTRRSGKQK